MLKFLRTTQYHKKYWAERKINWATSYTSTHNHPHRFLISKVLGTFKWLSLIEIGCGSGANLINIIKSFPGRQVGGVDVNRDAIEEAKKYLNGAYLKVNSGDDVMMSDDSTDVVLSDMCLIYVGPRKIRNYLKEMKRIGRHHIVLCEFHSDSWWNRMALRFNSGYYAYNYDKLLKKLGFYDIIKLKLRPEDWPEEDGTPGGEPQKTFCYIIKARIIK